MDTFEKGFVSGVLAGLPAIIWNWGMYYAHVSTLRYSDFVNYLTQGERPENTLELLFSFCVQMGWYGTLGIAFALIMTRLDNIRIVFKGIIWGSVMWFFFYSAFTLAKVPMVHHVHLRTALVNLVGSMIWGGVMSVILKWLKVHQQGGNQF